MRFLLDSKALLVQSVNTPQRCGFLPSPCGSYNIRINSLFVVNNLLSFQLIKVLEKAPEQSQRELSQRCGVSLGSIHYCLNALIEKGYVKAKNFRNAQNKLAYAYVLTPSGLNLKKELTVAFLKYKQAEYEACLLYTSPSPRD